MKRPIRDVLSSPSAHATNTDTPALALRILENPALTIDGESVQLESPGTVFIVLGDLILDDGEFTSEKIDWHWQNWSSTEAWASRLRKAIRSASNDEAVHTVLKDFLHTSKDPRAKGMLWLNMDHLTSDLGALLQLINSQHSENWIKALSHYPGALFLGYQFHPSTRYRAHLVSRQLNQRLTKVLVRLVEFMGQDRPEQLLKLGYDRLPKWRSAAAQLADSDLRTKLPAVSLGSKVPSVSEVFPAEGLYETLVAAIAYCHLQHGDSRSARELLQPYIQPQGRSAFPFLVARLPFSQKEKDRLEGLLLPEALRDNNLDRINIDRVIGGLVGRDVREITSAVMTYRQVNLFGFGGVGKTALALEAAHSLLERIPTVAFVELAGITNQQQCWPLIAKALNLERSEHKSPQDFVMDAVGKRHVLIVLDNCEQITPNIQQLASLFLERCPKLRLLLTCRHKTLQGHSVTIEPLSSKEAMTLLTRELERNNQPELIVPEALAELERKHAGFPLQIWLAVGLLGSLGLDAVLAHPDALTEALRSAGYGMLQPSYDLLTADQQRLLRCLGIFPTEFDLEALKEVVGRLVGHETSLLLIPQLVDRMLVTRITTPDREGADPLHEQRIGGALYSLPVPLREFVRDKLATDPDLPNLRRSYIRYYENLSRRIRTEIYEGTSHKQWLDRAERSYPNLMEAVRICQQEENVPLMGLDIYQKLWPFWDLMGRAQEGVELLTQAYSLCPPEAIKGPQKMRVMTAFGHLYYSLHDIPRCEAAYREALEETDANQQADADKDRANVLDNLGSLYRKQKGQTAEGIRFHQDSLQIREQLGDLIGQITSLTNIGSGYQELGELDLSIANQRRALALMEQVEAQRGPSADTTERRRVDVELNIGNTYLSKGDINSATFHLQNSLRLSKKLNNKQVQGMCLEGLGQAELQRGRWAAALSLLEQATAIVVQIHDQWGQRTILEKLSLLAAQVGALSLAATLLAVADHAHEHSSDGRSADDLKICNRTRQLISLGLSSNERDYSAAQGVGLSLVEALQKALKELPKLC